MKKFLILLTILIFPSALYVFLTAGKERSFVRLPYFGTKKIIRIAGNGKLQTDTAFYTIPPFNLFNSGGGKVTNETLKGRIWVASFIRQADTRTAPSISTLMDRVEERTNLDTTIRLVTFLLDSAGAGNPQAYAKMVHAGSRQIFLTGPGISVAAMAASSFYQPLDSSGAKGFNNFFLIDKEGCIRGIYNALSIKETDRLVDEISMLEAAYYIQNEKKNKNKEAD